MSKPYGHINSKHSVCMNCGDRRIGCHGVCKDYCEEVANANKIKEKKRKEKKRKEKKRKENKRKYYETSFALNHLDRPKVNRRSNNTPQRCHMK